MLTQEEIQELLMKGENTAVEFKQADIHPGALAKEIVAFANTKGGIILLGVNDQGDILVRAGSTNRVATQMELLRLFQATGAFHYDMTSIPGTSIKDLNFFQIDEYFRKYDFQFSEKSDEEKQRLLLNSDILSENAEVTLAGMLLFGINPLRFLPQCGISFAHFRENQITDELIDKKNLAGTLPVVVDTTLSVLKNNIMNASVIQGTKRVDKEKLINFPPSH